MLSMREKNRLQAIARLAPAGPVIIVASRSDGAAFEVAATLVAAGRTRLSAVGPFDPLALRAALGRPDLFGRVQAIIGASVSLSSQPRPPAALVCIAADGLPPGTLRAYGNGWARHVRAGGYLALWGGTAPSLQALGVTPAYWQAFPEGRPIELARRKSVG